MVRRVMNEVAEKLTKNLTMKAGTGTELQRTCNNTSQPFLFSSARHSLPSSSTSAAECSRPCCAWLDFQAPTSQRRERRAVPPLSAAQFG